MYDVVVEPIPKFRMFDLAVGFHVIATGKLLTAHGALVALRPVDVGVVPAVRDGFVTTDAAVQRREGAGQLDEQGRVVNVVVAPGGTGRAAAAVAARTSGAATSSSAGTVRRHGQTATTTGGAGSRWSAGH